MEERFVDKELLCVFLWEVHKPKKQIIGQKTLMPFYVVNKCGDFWYEQMIIWLNANNINIIGDGNSKWCLDIILNEKNTLFFNWKDCFSNSSIQF